MTGSRSACLPARPATAGRDVNVDTRLLPQDLLLVLLAAVLVRFVGLLGPGHGGDLFAFVEWAEDAASSGLGHYYAAGGRSNYPPMLYLLWPLGVAFDDGPLVFWIRTLSIPFDLALGYLLFRVVRSVTGSARDGVLGAALYLLNPAVILCGPMWGQVDGMGALPMVGAIVAVARGRLVWAGALAMVAGLVKPQFGIAAFTLLGLGLTWLRTWPGFLRAAVIGVAALATWVAVLAPMGLASPAYFRIMSETFSQYPYISHFGFNPWGAVFGFMDDDGAWFALGTSLAVAGIAGSLYLLRLRRDLVGLLGVSVLIGLVIYFLPTRVHERYLFGAIAFMAPLAAIDRGLRRPFIALSAMFFATLAAVLVTSPYRILPTPQLGSELPDWVISVLSALTTVAGAWAAWAVLGLFRAAKASKASQVSRASAASAASAASTAGSR